MISIKSMPSCPQVAVAGRFLLRGLARLQEDELVKGEGERCEWRELQAVPRVVARRGNICGPPHAVLGLRARAARLAGLVPPRSVALPAPQLCCRPAAWLPLQDADAADAGGRPMADEGCFAGGARAAESVQRRRG